MNSSPWLIQVYEMGDVNAQQSAASLLSDVYNLTVDMRTCDRGSYVVVESSDVTQAMAVYELVMMVDANAELIHSSTCASEVQAVRQRMGVGGESPRLADGDLLDV